MKKLLAILILSATCAAHAATVGITTGTPAQTVKLSNGSLLSTSGYVRVGFFLNGNTIGLDDPTPGVLATISQNFVPLGEAGSAAGYGTAGANTIAVNAASSIGGGISDLTFGPGSANTQVTGNVARGTKLFLLVYDQKDNPTELGIFSATTWTVPTSTLVNTANLTLTQVDTTAEVYRGGLGSLVLAPIPEPATGVMALIAAVGMIARRRR